MDLDLSVWTQQPALLASQGCRGVPQCVKSAGGQRWGTLRYLWLSGLNLLIRRGTSFPSSTSMATPLLSIMIFHLSHFHFRSGLPPCESDCATISSHHPGTLAKRPARSPSYLLVRSNYCPRVSLLSALGDPCPFLVSVPLLVHSVPLLLSVSQ